MLVRRVARHLRAPSLWLSPRVTVEAVLNAGSSEARTACLSSRLLSCRGCLMTTSSVATLVVGNPNFASAVCDFFCSLLGSYRSRLGWVLSL